MKTWAGIWTAIPVAAQATKPSFLQSGFSEYFLSKRKEYKSPSRMTKMHWLLTHQKLGGPSMPVFVGQISLYMYSTEKLSVKDLWNIVVQDQAQTYFHLKGSY